MSGTVPGGLGKTKEANAETQKICDEVKAVVESKAGKSFSTFQAKLYRLQVVSGYRYFIKVYVGDNSFIHIRVLQPSDGSPLDEIAVQLNKTEDDPIEPF